MAVREIFDDFERDTAVIALSRAQMREIGFGVTPMVGDAGPGVMPGLVLYRGAEGMRRVKRYRNTTTANRTRSMNT